MHKPSLDRMWETFIQLPIEGLSFNNYVQTLRFELHPIVSELLDKNAIEWYCFLLHGKSSGVPTSANDSHLYIHLRFSLKETADAASVVKMLPPSCVMTAPIDVGRIESITGVDKSALKDEDIEEAWRMIGQQSEWVLDFFSVHKEDVTISPQQISQFLHFFDNMTQVLSTNRTVFLPVDQNLRQ
jgi:hypothetical protein